jgi:hypothetical protein
MSDPLTEAMHKVNEFMAPIRAATLGYRQQLIDDGMDPDAASRCAADFHHIVIVQAVNGTGKGPK